MRLDTLRIMRVTPLASVLAVAIALGINPTQNAFAQSTWVGNNTANLSLAANWSPAALPVSGINTALVFNAAGTTGSTLNDNFANLFQLNSITFGAAAPGYIINGNSFNFRTNGTAVAPKIVDNSASDVTMNNALTLTNNFTVSGTGTGALTLNGVLSNVGSLTVDFPGTLILSNAANTFAGAIAVDQGTLGLASGTAIPTNRGMTVASGGSFSTRSFNNTATTQAGTFALDGGSFKLPNSTANYYLNKITNSIGGASVDFTGSAAATLHLVNASAGVTVGANASWIGAGASQIVNDTAAPIDIQVSPAATLTSTAKLGVGALSQGFRITGGGTLSLNNSATTANLNADAAIIDVDDFASLGSGTVSLTNTSASTVPGTLRYDGAPATLSKALAVGPGGGRILYGTLGFLDTLVVNGVISDAAAGGKLILEGTALYRPVFNVTANNTYTGPTQLRGGGTLSIASFNNGGVAGPLGMSSSAPANLVLGEGVAQSIYYTTLRYTGPTTTTDRGLTLDTNYGFVEVSDVDANLTMSGQLTGPGSIIKSGPGTLTLTNTSNNFAGDVSVEGGKLVVGANGAVLPAGGDVALTNGELDFASRSNDAASRIGVVKLVYGGVLRGSGGTLYLNRLESGYSSIELTGGALRFGGAGAGVLISADTTWNGGQLINESGAAMDIVINPGVTLTRDASVISIGGSNRFTGGGTYFRTGGSFTNGTTFDHTTLRVDDAAFAATSLFIFDGGTFQYNGPSTTTQAFTIAGDGATIDIPNGSTLTFNSAFGGAGSLRKTGRGTIVLKLSPYLPGDLAIDNGVVETSQNLGFDDVTIGALGKLRYTASTDAHNEFVLNGGAIEAPAGVSVRMIGAHVGGGYLRGSGNFELISSTLLSGVTTFSSTSMSLGGVSLVNFTNGGAMTVSPGTSTWDGGTNAASGRLTLPFAAHMDVSELVSYGQITIGNSAILENAGSSLVLGAGSRTTIGSVGTVSGQLKLNGQTLEMNGALLVNNGTIVGTTNVNYGSLLKGAGVFGTVNVTDGGRFSPGNSPGAATLSGATFGGGGSYVFELSDAAGVSGVAIDRINISTVLDIAAGTTPNSQFVIELASLNASNLPGLAANFSSSVPSSFTLVHTALGITGFSPDKFRVDTSAFANSLGGGQFAVAQAGNDLLLTFSPGTLTADFDDDHDVDGVDLGRWRTNYGTGTTHSQGDADGNGLVDGNDFLQWQRQLNQTPATSAVPEPTAWTICAATFIVLIAVRRSPPRLCD